jgi:site-specific recombinase XerD
MSLSTRRTARTLATVSLPSLEGTALEERNVRHVFTRILQKAELCQIRIHDLRHTFASLLLQ